MKSILEFFIRKHLLASLLTIMVLLLGVSALQTINKDLYPRVKLNEVYITTLFPGASSEDVEKNVTVKIEKEIKSVTGIAKFSSISVENLSLITVLIDDELNERKINEAITEIRNAVSRVYNLPDGVEGNPKVERINTGLIPVIGVGVQGDSLSYDSLRTIAKRVQKEFEKLHQIAKVNQTGISDKEVQIELLPKKMERYAISPDEIIQILQARAVQNSIGFTRSKMNQKSVVMHEEFGSIKELKNLIIRTSFDGPAIRLGKVAKITETFVEKNSVVRVNGNDVIYFSILKKESADIIKSVNAIKNKISNIEKSLPEGVKLVTSADMSRYVKTSFDVVRNNGIVGFILVFIILTLFLNMRVAFWVALGIPVSLLGVVFFLPFFNVTLDVITLASMILVLGIIVDDAIVISERIYQRWEMGESPLEAATSGIRDVFWPVVTTVVSTLLAFLPIFLIPGDMGKFIFVIPLTVSLALTISMVEGVVALPSHIAIGIKRRPKQKSKIVSGFFIKIKTLFEKVLFQFLRFRYVMLALFTLVFIGTLFLAFNKMSVEMFPSEGAEEFAIYLETPQGTPLEQTTLKAREIEEIIEKLPQSEIQSYTTTVGEPGIGRSGINQITVSIDLTPYSSRERNANEIAEEVRSLSNSLEGFNMIFVDVSESGPNAEKPISLQIVGSNDSLRTLLAQDVTAFLKNQDGVFNIKNNDKEKTEEVLVSVKRERLPRYSLTEAEVYQYLRRAFNGEVVAQKQARDELIKYRVIFPKCYQENPKKLLNTKLINQNQRLILLQKLIRFENGENNISYPHFNGQRAFYVEASVDNEKTSAVEVVNTLSEQFDLATDYPGTDLIIEGAAKKTKESTNDLLRTFIFAFIGIYILLVLLFDSLVQPLLVLMAVPFGVIGVILVFLGHGEPLSFMAALGIIGLSGVVVNDSLVLVDNLNKLIKESPDKPIWELITKGTSDRLRAIILTTITTVGGILPLAYGIGGADPMNAPMALALGWGLLFATPLTLVLVPCLYGGYLDLKAKFHKND